MSLFAPQFQIVSDLHLETPLTQPQYNTFRLQVHANNLFLLGDIGLIRDDDLFDFLRRLLSQNRGLRIFYVLGNHEAYHMTYNAAVQKMRDFQTEAESHYGGRFILLNRDRYDLDSQITILGCLLWSNVLSHQTKEVSSRLTDFNETRGIKDWTLTDHMREHERDLAWLNGQMRTLERESEATGTRRQVIVVTHHAPTVDSRAIAPGHRDSPVSSGFASDLSNEVCWSSDLVKGWAFGHTHHSVCYEDGGKIVVANQKGYGMSSVETIVLEPTSKSHWNVLRPDQTKDATRASGDQMKAAPQDRKAPRGSSGGSVSHRITKRISALFRSRPHKSDEA